MNPWIARRPAPKLALALALAGLLAAAFLAGCAGGAVPRPDVTSGPSPAALDPPSVLGQLEPFGAGRSVLVVYFSPGGAAERIALDLAALCSADIEEIREPKARRFGFLGYFSAGAASSFKTAPRIVAPVRQAADYELVIVCAPVWAWKMAPPVRTWLRAFRGTFKAVAFVTVSGDTGPDRIVRDMAAEAGLQPLSYAGFAERDQYPENRAAYLAKLASFLAPLR